MEQPNQTMVSNFIIKGFSDIPTLQTPIFLLVLFIYLITLGGNMPIILLVCLDRHLHTPMYFFLVNLSVIDLSTTTVTLHKTLLINLTGNRIISYAGCITQMYFFGSLLCDELLFLTAMGYDRYVAVCNPLRYTIIINHKVCIFLASVCWVLGFIETVPCVVLVTGFSCYSSNILNHFFCDLLPIIKLSCSDTSVLETLFIVEGAVIVALGPFLLTFLSYLFIIRAILRIHSSTGRRKAFYTCSSHITVVLLLNTTLTYQYLKPISADSLEYNKLMSLLNKAAVPMLNPFIYSLKNKDVKSAFKKRLGVLGTKKM